MNKARPVPDRSPNTTRAALLRAFRPMRFRNTALSPTAIPLNTARAGGFITDTVLKSGRTNGMDRFLSTNRIQKLAANDWESNRAGLDRSPCPQPIRRFVRRPDLQEQDVFLRFGRGAACSSIRSIRRRVRPAVSGLCRQWGSGRLGREQCSCVPRGRAWWGVGTVLHVYPCSMSGSILRGPSFGRGERDYLWVPVFNRLRAVSPVSRRDHRDPTGRGFWTAGLTYFDSTGTAVPAYGTVTVSDPNTENEERFSVKVDHHFSERDSANVSLISSRPRSRTNSSVGQCHWSGVICKMGASRLVRELEPHVFGRPS